MSPNEKKSSKIKSPVVVPQKEKPDKKSVTPLIPSNNKNTPSKKKKKSSLKAAITAKKSSAAKKSLSKKKEIEENKKLLKVNNKSLSKLNEEIKDLFNSKTEDDSETFTDFLKKQEPKQRHFSQESSFSSVSENGKTKSFKSVKGSFSVENPEETKKMCDKMSESNPNIQCTYNEKENVCYLDMTSMVGNIVDTLGMGQKLNDDTQKVKDYLNKMLSSTMIQPRVVPSSSGYSGSPQRMMPPSEHFSPVKRMSPKVFIIQGHLPKSPMSQYQPHPSPHPFMMFGGDSCSIGKQNSCPDNGRLIYDTQGKIDCGNMSNQGGQQFMYPKKITNFVGGHKKSLKKKKKYELSGGAQDTFKNLLDKILDDSSAVQLRVLLGVDGNNEIQNTNFCGLSSVKIIETVALSPSKISDQDKIEFLTSVFSVLESFKDKDNLRDKVGRRIYEESKKKDDNTFSFSPY